MVLFLVLQSGKPRLEVFVTVRAFEGPVLAVENHVLLQMRSAGEGLQTDLDPKGGTEQRAGNRHWAVTIKPNFHYKN